MSIIGNTKNAGKTTVMNAYLEQLTNSVAITSIGLDGEEIDQVTLLEKPRIFVKPGYYIATALETLEKFTCSYEIVKELDIQTSIGKVVIVKAQKQGRALVAGPAKVNDMIKLIKALNDYQLSKIIIDGAFSRQVFARVTQATILVIGANYNRDISVVVNNASLIYKKLNLKKLYDNPYSFGDIICLVDTDGKQIELDYSSIIGKVDDFFSLDLERIKLAFFPKSLTNKFIERMIEERKRCKFDIVIDSPINIQVNNNSLEKLFKLKNNLYVLNPIELALVCYNPFSPRGYEFNDDEFKEKLEMALNRNVINVLKDGAYEQIKFKSRTNKVL